MEFSNSNFHRAFSQSRSPQNAILNPAFNADARKTGTAILARVSQAHNTEKQLW